MRGLIGLPIDKQNRRGRHIRGRRDASASAVVITTQADKTNSVLTKWFLLVECSVASPLVYSMMIESLLEGTLGRSGNTERYQYDLEGIGSLDLCS